MSATTIPHSRNFEISCSRNLVEEAYLSTKPAIGTAALLTVLLGTVCWFCLVSDAVNMEPMTPWSVMFSHATNSHAQLQEALSSDMNFLEADVTLTQAGIEAAALGLGSYVGGLLSEQVVMGRPPLRTGDLTLVNFLEGIARHNVAVVHSGRLTNLKSVKLDLQDPQSVPFVLAQCAHVRFENGPAAFGSELWLHAEVLMGPGRVTPAFDAETFVRFAVEHMDTVKWTALSLGWTTQLPVTGGYTDAMLSEMLSLVRRHNLVGRQVSFVLSSPHAFERLEAVWMLVATGHTLTMRGVCEGRCATWLTALSAEFPDQVYFLDGGGFFTKSRVRY